MASAGMASDDSGVESGHLKVSIWLRRFWGIGVTNLLKDSGAKGWASAGVSSDDSGAGPLMVLNWWSWRS